MDGFLGKTATDHGGRSTLKNHCAYGGAASLAYHGVHCTKIHQNVNAGVHGGTSKYHFISSCTEVNRKITACAEVHRSMTACPHPPTEAEKINMSTEGQ